VVIGACAILSSRGLSEQKYLLVLGTSFHPSPLSHIWLTSLITLPRKTEEDGDVDC
jgi:hypothetical protein